MHVVSHGSSSGKSQGSSAKRFPKTGPSSKATTTTNSNSGAGQMRNAFNIGSTSVTKSKGPRGATVYKIGNQKFTLDGRNGKTLDDVIEVHMGKKREVNDVKAEREPILLSFSGRRVIQVVRAKWFSVSSLFSERERYSWKVDVLLLLP